VLPLLYHSDTVAREIIEDPQTASIPDVHKAMFRWVEKFTRHSWDMTEADIQQLRDLGVGDEHIVEWAQVACLQTWWVMSADGGGIPLEGNAVTGVAVKHTRDWYENKEGGSLASAPGAARVERPSSGGISWVRSDETAEVYQRVAAHARERYGFAPNIYSAVSLVPDILPRHELAFEVLECPQSASLSPLRHAMVRALVSSLNRSAYSAATTRALILATGGDDALFDRVTHDYTSHDWSPADRAVLDFAAKMARNHYKVTAADAQSFREAGLDDEAYVDVLNTVSIQTSLDRLANALGVRPDDRAIMPIDASATTERHVEPETAAPVAD